MKELILLTVLFLFLCPINLNSQWIEQTSGVNTPLNCVYTTNTEVWICGNNGTILKTTNGGAPWLNVPSGIPSTINLQTIYCVTPLRIVTAGINISGTSFVFRTTDGGVSWQNTFSLTGCNIYGFSYSLDKLYLIGSPSGGRWNIFRSTNYGLDWDSTGLYLPRSSSETGFFNSVFGLMDRIWFGTNNSRIYSLTTGDGSWEIQSTAPMEYSTSVWFKFNLTDEIGYGLTSGEQIMKSTNLGSIWNPIATPGTGIINRVSGSPLLDDLCWFSRADKIYKSLSGTGWSLEYTAPNGAYNHISNNLSGNQGVWAVRNSGGISKYDGFTGIHPISIEIPEEFSLSQNFPNPFNPSTKIEFAIPVGNGRDRSFLVIYDALGREIETLVNEQLNPGTYEINWNASNHPSGVYFYKLVSGDFTKTIKMTLLK